ncbi:DUF4397 domain-containing protein [Lachnospiraceae bacterium 54-53]
MLFNMQNDRDTEEREPPENTGYGSPPEEAGREPAEDIYLNIPAPNLEEDWPIYYLPGLIPEPAGAWTSVITMVPKPIVPCFFCDSTEYGLVRFLNAAAGYNPFLIYINDRLVVNGLDNGELSEYGRVSVELQTVTIADENGYVYLEKQINVPDDGAITAALINTDSGLDLMEITDLYCNGGINTGCFRVCNLSITNRNINVLLNGGAAAFSNIGYREVTSFQYVLTGYYLVSVSGSSAYSLSVLLTTNLYIRGNTSYTLYVFNWDNTQDAIRILIVEDRRE